MVRMNVFKMGVILVLLPATGLAQPAKPGEVESKTSAGLHYGVKLHAAEVARRLD